MKIIGYRRYNQAIKQLHIIINSIYLYTTDNNLFTQSIQKSQQAVDLTHLISSYSANL